MMKLVWTMISHPDKLWVRIMKAKYSCGPFSIPKFNIKSSSTSTWRAMANAWEDVKNNVIWVINNGQNTKFWRDNWIPGVGALVDILESSIPPAEIDFPVFHYCSDGNWNWHSISRSVPAEICDKIAFIKPPSPGASDLPCWSLISDGYFSIKSAYEVILKPPHANGIYNQSSVSVELDGS